MYFCAAIPTYSFMFLLVFATFKLWMIEILQFLTHLLLNQASTIVFMNVLAWACILLDSKSGEDYDTLKSEIFCFLHCITYTYYIWECLGHLYL